MNNTYDSGYMPASTFYDQQIILRRGLGRLSFLLPLFLFTFLLFTACSDDDDDMPNVTPTATGTFTDTDGSVYGWVRIGNLEWMAQSYHGGQAWNTQTVISDNGFEEDLYSDFSDEEEDSLILARGNFYTLQQALDLCPDGWRLPTDDDWKQLETALGMSGGDADKEGWRNGAGLLMQQSADEGTGLAMQCPGEITAWATANPSMYRVGDYGYYWSSTIDTTKVNQCAYIRVITPVTNRVERVATTTRTNFLSVRYVRDAQ